MSREENVVVSLFFGLFGVALIVMIAIVISEIEEAIVRKKNGKIRAKSSVAPISLYVAWSSK